jgi:hypothetical protein
MSRPNSWLYCLLYSRFICARIVTEPPDLRIVGRDRLLAGPDVSLPFVPAATFSPSAVTIAPAILTKSGE